MNFRLIILFVFFHVYLIAQNEQKLNIYNPLADAKGDIKKAVALAEKENKNVIIQVSGNWCSWCVKFHNLINEDAKIDSMIKANYIYIYVNYSKENKNPDVLKELGNPQRFGFPVLVVLDKKGRRIHTQDTGFLELDKGYDPKKVMEFLKGWTAPVTNEL